MVEGPADGSLLVLCCSAPCPHLPCEPLVLSSLGRSRGGHGDPGLVAPQGSEPRQVQGCSQRRALLSGSRWIQSKVGLFALLK